MNKEQIVVQSLNRVLAAAAKSLGDAQYHDALRQDCTLLANFVSSIIQEKQVSDSQESDILKE